jgi:hypothetical protein
MCACMMALTSGETFSFLRILSTAGTLLGTEGTFEALVFRNAVCLWLIDCMEIVVSGLSGSFFYHRKDTILLYSNATRHYKSRDGNMRDIVTICDHSFWCEFEFPDCSCLIKAAIDIVNRNWSCKGSDC